MERSYNMEDVRKLYDAFITLCDYVEENVHCGKCPMWDSLCGNKDKTAVNEFSEALARIREVTGIERA